MKTFKQFLDEGFSILHSEHEEEKAKHSKHVFHMVQKAYEHIGGIHGSGFKDHHDMVKNIHTWKMHRDSDGKVRAVGLYKHKNGQMKRVAVATDGTKEGKKGLSHIVNHDLKNKRAYVETSGPSLNFHKKVHGDVKKYALTHKEVRSRLKGDEIRRAPHDDPEVKRHPELKDHFYQRKIGNEWHTKVALGK